MELGKLYIVWKDNPPSNAVNVYRVNEDIDFTGDKAVFKIANGNTVRVNVDQIMHIGLSGKNETVNKYLGE